MLPDNANMKTLVFDRESQGRLEYRTVPKPKVRGNQILIKINASSLNPHDWKYYDTLKRMYKLPVPLPALTLGHDLSGTIVDTGSSVSRFKVGDEVFAMSMKTGAFGQYLAIDYRMAAPKPKKLSDLEAASLPMVTLTAWQAFLLAKLRAGEHVLVVGGSGGVGSQAVQIARAKGAQVTAVCSTSNIELVHSLGAEKCIDYKRENMLESGLRFDVVFDTVGSLTPLSVKRILTPGGRFVSIVTDAQIILSTLLSRIPGVPINNTSTFIALPLGRHLAEIGQLVDAGAIRPVIDREFAIEDIEAAIASSKTGRSRGKIVLAIR